MEGSIRLILAVDAVLELPRQIRALQRGFALAHNGMEGRLVPDDRCTPPRRQIPLDVGVSVVT
eukprot:628888-Rhodomonas_salina.1